MASNGHVTDDGMWLPKVLWDIRSALLATAWLLVTVLLSLLATTSIKYRLLFASYDADIIRTLYSWLYNVCSSVQTASRCVDELLASSCSAEEIAENPHLRSIGFYSPEAIDYVCVQNYDGNVRFLKLLALASNKINWVRRLVLITKPKLHYRTYSDQFYCSASILRWLADIEKEQEPCYRKETARYSVNSPTPNDSSIVTIRYDRRD